jgi:ATP-dependent RNA helicase SUPV3L1/SUV3
VLKKLLRKIRRVIFESVWKFDGKRDTLLSVSQMKQIAGRAGRFGMHGADEKPGGFVTTLKVEDLPILRKTLALQVPPLLYARIAPPGPMFSSLASRLPANATTESIFLASMHAGLCPPYCRPNIPDQLSTVCDYMDQLGHFTLPDKIFIMQAPFPWRDRTALETINTFIGTYYQSMNVDLVPILERLGYMEMLENAEAAMKSPEGRGTTGRRFKPSNELPGLETFHKILVAYMWLSFRNPVSYSAQDQTMELKERLEHTLHWCLQEMTRIDGKNSVHVQSKRAPIVFKTPREMQLEVQQLGASEAQKRTASAELLSAPI